MDLGGLTAAVARNEYGWVHTDNRSVAMTLIAKSTRAGWHKLVAAVNRWAETLSRSPAALPVRSIQEARL